MGQNGRGMDRGRGGGRGNDHGRGGHRGQGGLRFNYFHSGRKSTIAVSPEDQSVYVNKEKSTSLPPSSAGIHESSFVLLGNVAPQRREMKKHLF